MNYNLKAPYINFNSTVDVKGKIAALVFLQECNLKCPYCYNKPLQQINPHLENFSISKIEKLITSNKGLHSIVLFSGGEPTLNDDLLKFIRRFKYKSKINPIGLQTNGTTDNLTEIIQEKLVEYIHLDYKADCLLNNQQKEIRHKNISLLLQSEIEFIFSVTAINQEEANFLIKQLHGELNDNNIEVKTQIIK